MEGAVSTPQTSRVRSLLRNDLGGPAAIIAEYRGNGEADLGHARPGRPAHHQLRNRRLSPRTGSSRRPCFPARTGAAACSILANTCGPLEQMRSPHSDGRRHCKATKASPARPSVGAMPMATSRSRGSPALGDSFATRDRRLGGLAGRSLVANAMAHPVYRRATDAIVSSIAFLASTMTEPPG